MGIGSITEIDINFLALEEPRILLGCYTGIELMLTVIFKDDILMFNLNTYENIVLCNYSFSVLLLLQLDSKELD